MTFMYIHYCWKNLVVLLLLLGLLFNYICFASNNCETKVELNKQNKLYLYLGFWKSSMAYDINKIKTVLASLNLTLYNMWFVYYIVQTFQRAWILQMNHLHNKWLVLERCLRGAQLKVFNRHTFLLSGALVPLYAACSLTVKFHKKMKIKKTKESYVNVKYKLWTKT